MKPTPLLCAVAGTILGLAVGCGGHKAVVTTTTPVNTVEQTGTVAQVRPVTIHETEFRLTPVHASGGPEGLVQITLVNDGKVPHALAVDGPNGEVDFDGQVDPGHTGTMQADLDQPGTYRMWCPLDHHRDKGMVGTITVGGSSPARASEPTSTATTTTATTPTQTQTQTQTRTQTRTNTVTRTQTTTTSTTTTGSGGGGGYSGY